MLSMAAMGGGSGRYYADIARADYYSQGGEPLGRWLGRGADRLGLGPEPIQKQDFLRLFRGFDQDNVALVQNAGREGRHPGWDLTFSAPKGVSVLWGLVGDSERRAIEGAHHAAVTKAIAFLEQEAAFTKRGKGGVGIEPVTGLVVACYLHGTSRAKDSNLHTHALVLNTAGRDDGTWGTIVGRPLFVNKMVAGALYRAELARGLERLGLEAERCNRDPERERDKPEDPAKPRDLFDVSGVHSSLKDDHSTRSKQVKDLMDQWGARGAKAKQAATLQSRPEKEHLPRKDLIKDWRSMAEMRGLTREAVAAMFARDPVQRDSEHELRAALPRVEERLMRRASTFVERDFLRHLAEEAPGRGFGVDEIVAATRNHLRDSPSIVRLGREPDGDVRYTTRALYELEERVLASVKASTEDAGHTVSEKNLKKAIDEVERARTTDARKPFRFSEEQLAALRHITQNPGSMHVIEGLAGTGKTVLFEAARRAWELEGFRVFGAALSGKAARGLEEGSGIQSATIERRLRDLDRPTGLTLDDFKFKRREDLPADHRFNQRAMLDPEWKDFGSVNGMLKYAERVKASRKDTFVFTKRTVLVVDEASMAELPQIARLAEAARSAGASIVWSGDSRQLLAIEGPSAFRAMGEKLGSADLFDIQRQREAWAKKAAKQFALGEAARALREFAVRGLVHVAEDRNLAMAQLTKEWAWNGGASRPQEHLILASTRADASHLNWLAQIERQNAGLLGKRSIDVDGVTIHEGDRVLLLKNDKSYGVENGTLAVVELISKKHGTVRVKTDDGRTTTINVEDFWQPAKARTASGREINTRREGYRHLTLGYAATTHKLQGATVENAYVLAGGPMQDRALSYVQATRARGMTRFYTDRLEAGDELANLAHQMSQGRDKPLAHEFEDRTPEFTRDRTRDRER